MIEQGGVRHIKRRFIQLILGSSLSALGIYTTIQANIGLAPWDAFAIGLSNITGISIGTASMALGGVCVLLAVLLKEPIGIGTIVCTFWVGLLLDGMIFVNLIPAPTSFTAGLLLLLLGQILLCSGTYFYISTGLGTGPRDSLTIALTKRWRTLPVGLIRGLLDGFAALSGWLLGAKIGLGTILTVVGFGACLQIVFRLFRFDVAALTHESFLQTCRNIAASHQSRKTR